MHKFFLELLAAGALACGNSRAYDDLCSELLWQEYGLHYSF